MASVKRFPGSAYWYACYKVPTGKIDRNGKEIFKRLQRSTRLTDEGRALQLAISYERAAVMVAEKRWSQHSAHDFLKQVAVLAGVQSGHMEQTNVFLNRWLEGRKRVVAEKTSQNYSGVVADFLEWLGSAQNGPLIDVNGQLMAKFRDAELAQGKSGTTVNKALAILSDAFEEAVITQVLERNPAKGLRIKNADNMAQERTPFTFEQFRELVRRMGPGEKSTRGRTVHSDWQTFIILTAYTGGRQQEVAQAEWANIDFQNRLIGLRRTKKHDAHWIPMHPTVHSHLQQLREKSGKNRLPTYIVPSLAALSERRMSRIFRETILPRIGISQPYAERTEEKGVGRRLAAYSIHSLRHSLSTWLHAAGVPEMMRMRIVGHEDERVSRRYTHTELFQAAAELAKVPSL